MRRLLGPHLGGRWTHKLELLRKWQPSFVLVLQPEVEKVAQLREACPQAIIAGRFYHEDSHYASNISIRPKEFAREIHQEIISNPVTPLLDYVQSNNETNQDWQGIQKLNEFTQEWMALADQSGAYKCAILAFSVGNPDMPHKPGDPAGFDGRMLYWQQVLPSLNYAQRNNHLLLLHAYGYPNMFAPDADWFIYRYERQVQANLRTLGITNLKYAYGEIGIDRLIVNGKGGYKVVTNDQDYVNQLLQWERDLQGQSLLLGGAIFTFGDSGGWDTYDIADTTVASLIATHYVNHANEYEPPVGVTNVPQTTHIPAVSTGTPPTQPAPELPPREWDERLTARGVKVIKAQSDSPTQPLWHLVRARFYNEQEAGGRHHLYISAIDENGQPVNGVPFLVKGGGSETKGNTNGYSGFNAANVPMWASEGKNGYSLKMWEGDTVTGLGMGEDTPSGFNAGVHTAIELVFQQRKGAQPTPPVEEPDTPPTVPAPQPASALGYVSAPAGAWIRATPNATGDKIVAVPYAEQVRITAVGNQDGWVRVRWGDSEGWMSSRWISLQPPVALPTEPTPAPTGDNWSRAWPIVLQIEGGLSLDPNDSGNYYQGKLIGTKYGISAAVWGGQYDIPNLTKEQALSIYRKHYWEASGADKLPWPMCLIVFDTAIQHGVGVAQKLLTYKPSQEEIYLGLRALRYMDDPKWRLYGEAWGVRVDRLQDIVQGES